MFASSSSPSKCVTEPAFERRDVGRVAEREDVRAARATAACAGSVGHEVELVAEARASARRSAAPPCSGTVTSRSNGISRPS